MRVNKEGNKVEKHVVLGWGMFAEGHEDSVIANVFIDMDSEQLPYCFAEDIASCNAFEFRTNNILEIVDRYRNLEDYDDVQDFEADITKANVAMLMTFGTILLPVQKNDTTTNFRAQEEAIMRDLVSRARSGDIEAEEDLHKMAKKQETDLRERLTQEDLLSVFEGYFLNLIEQSGLFSILADIHDVDEITNEASREKLYRLSVSVTGIKMTLYVNQEDIVGMPMQGMRIMGMGLLQGNVMFT